MTLSARLVLRLDNGSLIGQGQRFKKVDCEGKAVLITPEEAVTMGRVDKQRQVKYRQYVNTCELLAKYRSRNILDELPPGRMVSEKSQKGGGYSTWFPRRCF